MQSIDTTSRESEPWSPRLWLRPFWEWDSRGTLEGPYHLVKCIFLSELHIMPRIPPSGEEGQMGLPEMAIIYY